MAAREEGPKVIPTKRENIITVHNDSQCKKCGDPIPWEEHSDVTEAREKAGTMPPNVDNRFILCAACCAGIFARYGRVIKMARQCGPANGGMEL